MPYKRGDVVLVLFPDSNLRTPKRRPALVIQADNLATGLPQTNPAGSPQAFRPSGGKVRLSSTDQPPAPAGGTDNPQNL
jgi:mRNA-degrading endonuclease toxin of MazEF toxin-antitoxin module